MKDILLCLVAGGDVFPGWGFTFVSNTLSGSLCRARCTRQICILVLVVDAGGGMRERSAWAGVFLGVEGG